jgi:hypothetical protein
MTTSKPDPNPCTVTDTQLAQLALDHGWGASRTTLYDEDGVEGWLWAAPNGSEYTVMGDWTAPTIGEDDRLRSAIIASLP